MGWGTNNPYLRAFIPNAVPMNPVTAICFLLLTIAIALMNRPNKGERWLGAVHSIAFVVAFISILRLISYIMGVDPGIDKQLFSAQLEAQEIPNRMAPNTAIGFLFLSLAILWAGKTTRGFYPSELFAFITALIALLTLIGYAYNAHAVTRMATTIPMALNTGLCFLLTSLAFLCSPPYKGIMQAVLANNPCGYAAQRLMIASAFIPSGIGWLTLKGKQLGWYQEEINTGLFVVISTALLAVVVGGCALVLSHADEERQRAKEEAEEAEEANQAKSEFLSRMSHELRTPLNSVLGFSQLLEMESPTPRQREHIEQILKAGRHLVELVNEVLDIARIESGRMPLSLEPVPLREVVESAVSLLRPMASEKNITISINFENPNATVLADRQRLSQVVLNLLSNAVKYNIEGGRIQVNAYTPSNYMMRLEITDTGIGIPANRRNLLFVPFSRLTEDAQEGTGLGLALSKGLVEAMLGHIGYKPAPHGGSTFYIELRKAHATKQGEHHAINAPRAAPFAIKYPATILYVKDNAPNVRILQHALASYPHWTLLVAMNGKEALETMETNTVNFILLDLGLSDISGRENSPRKNGK